MTWTVLFDVCPSEPDGLELTLEVNVRDCVCD